MPLPSTTRWARRVSGFPGTPALFLGKPRARTPLVLLLFLVVAAQPGHAQSRPEYRVAGEINGLAEGSKVFLIHGGQRRTIDSATVTNGTFVLRGHLPEPAHTYLHAGRGRRSTKLADILLDNQPLAVKGGAPVYDSVRVSGSQIDQQWKAWLHEDERIGRSRHQLRQVVQSLRLQHDTASARELDRLVGQLQAVRVRLLKAYVTRYRDTAAGAALPTLCTLGPSLTGNDYREMYDTLTPAWQQSSFGKEILAQARKKGTAPTAAPQREARGR
ncbi:DUF4369 domain-containing protein [Hymenobacter arizonensis]|uniref:DUF4369 domain-containing protein n=1 Tax=Hymenobacter arizonensis TaxID=1227077 RepID=A0A1I6BEK3_HYMAR|nr:DUF4369 domain-containing protein [Hymenobacter arizonensis]SFQ79370.1 protein of unknown function [Hymenobacter arizonensis]